MEFERLVSSFYDLSSYNKQKVLYEEIDKMRRIIDSHVEIDKIPVSDSFIKYQDEEDEGDIYLVKMYHELLLINEILSVSFKN